MEQTKIGVTGATGQLGRKVITHLKQSIPAGQIVALVRDPEKAKDLGVEVRTLDYTNPELISLALKGLSKVLLISSSEIGKRFGQHKNVIDEAKRAGVPFVAYTSILRADTSTLPLAPEHKLTEEYLKASGLTYALLRNGWYIENYTSSLGNTIKAGAVYGSAGDGKISAATRSDYAKAAVKVLTTEGHDNKAYELGGYSFTLTEYAAEISRLSGKDIKYINLPADEYAKVLEEQAGFPAPMARMFAEIDLDIAKGELETDAGTLEKLAGGSLSTLEDSIKEALHTI
ncbi:MAG: SDR family oxidoreductase [Chitinophagaceae bacterium]|nr:SDR family oxidoreductase [Chitinophagaceae bacterium]